MELKKRMCWIFFSLIYAAESAAEFRKFGSKSTREGSREAIKTACRRTWTLKERHSLFSICFHFVCSDKEAERKEETAHLLLHRLMTNKPWSHWSQWVWGLSDWRALPFKKIENRLWKILNVSSEECYFCKNTFMEVRRKKIKEQKPESSQEETEPRWLKIETLSQGIIGAKRTNSTVGCWPWTGAAVTAQSQKRP